ncbi:MAG: phage holin family protein [Anaerolineae bacterium]|nr:phage holin family protein [Anaerolineae bacterium]MDW8100789.1 phage holin family protein [Anaerolineae bacterium]
MNRLLIRLVINAAALWVAAQLVEGIHAERSVETLVVVALIFGLVNAFIRPVLAVLTCPLRIMTLGLFTLVLNAFMLWLTSAVASWLGVEFRVEGFFPAFWGALVISFVSVILSLFISEEKRRN